MNNTYKMVLCQTIHLVSGVNAISQLYVRDNATLTPLHYDLRQGFPT